MIRGGAVSLGYGANDNNMLCLDLQPRPAVHFSPEGAKILFPLLLVWNSCLFLRKRTKDTLGLYGNNILSILQCDSHTFRIFTETQNPIWIVWVEFSSKLSSGKAPPPKKKKKS